MSFGITKTGMFSSVAPAAAFAASGVTTATALGFYGGAGVSQPSSYTTGASTASRAVPTTVAATTLSTLAFTAAVSDRVAALSSSLNQLISVTNNIVGDLKAWNLSG